MKKLNTSLSIIATSLLLIFASCKKQDIATSNPYVKPVTQGFVDTPYRSTNQFADTPYRRLVVKPVNAEQLPISTQFADTPYLSNNHFADTPYLKRNNPVKNLK